MLRAIPLPSVSRPGATRRGGVRRLVGATLTAATVAAVAVLVAVAAAPRLGWFRVETVLSGSMRPAFAPGDLILVRPEPASAVRAGQVISYSIPVGDHHVESHRIVRVVRGGAHPVVITKGDANGAPDPWRARLDSPTAWRLWLVVPKLGLVIGALRSPAVHLLTVLIAPLALAALWLMAIWRPRPART